MLSSLSCSRWLTSAALTLALAAAPSGSPLTIVNGANSGSTPLAPQSVAVAFGSFPGVTETVPPGAPTSVAGLQVLVGGQAARLLYVSDRQINFVVPDQVEPPTAQVQVQRNGSPVASSAVDVARSSPVLFPRHDREDDAGLILNATGAVNSAANPAAAGSQIRLFATGMGLQPRAEDIGVMIGLRHVRNAVITADPGLPGVWMIQIALPSSGLMSGLTPLAVHAGGRASNTVTLYVQ
ncbi:MAG: hypothetical protein JNK87_09525 [Bryobacterales bacterium]|nr:hypothetical protein [Bryobacterales bacterium]